MYVNDNINNKLSKLSISDIDNITDKLSKLSISIFKNFYNEIIILRKRKKTITKDIGQITYDLGDLFNFVSEYCKDNTITIIIQKRTFTFLYTFIAMQEPLKKYQLRPSLFIQIKIVFENIIGSGILRNCVTLVLFYYNVICFWFNYILLLIFKCLKKSIIKSKNLLMNM